jgi:ribosomal protein S1
MTDFGVFVELRPGVDSLLHLTEVPRSRHGELKPPAETRAELVVLVTSLDLERRRIGLALAPEGATPGAHVESKVAPPTGRGSGGRGRGGQSGSKAPA